MTYLLRAYNRHFIIGTLVLIAVGVAVAWAVHTAVDWSMYASWRSRLSALPRSHDAQPDARAAIIPFRFRGATRFVRVRVDARELAAARELPTDLVYDSRGEVRTGYLRDLVRYTSEGVAVSDMAGGLRALRDELGLDSDEYVELMTRMVQSIPYGTPRAEFGLPVEVADAGTAVCADKSVLLAALLLHEGYDAGVWVFDSQLHAGAAVRGTGAGYRDSGYAFIETTSKSFIGEVGPSYAGAGPWGFDPQLVTVGGRRRYTADVESEFIASQLQQAQRSARKLAPFHAYLAKASPHLRREYASLVGRQVADSRLAVRIEEVSDDRERALELLLPSTGR